MTEQELDASLSEFEQREDRLYNNRMLVVMPEILDAMEHEWLEEFDEEQWLDEMYRWDEERYPGR